MTDRWRWLIALVLPLGILGASFALEPALFEVRLAGGEVQPAETAPFELYATTHRAFFFTTEDLLHPETFGPGGPALEAVAVDVVPTPERPPGERTAPTWVLQLGYLLTLRDASGRPIVAGWEATEEDRQAGDALAALFDGRHTFERGDAVVLDLPEGAAARQLTGLRAIAFLAVAQPVGGTVAPDALAFDAALAKAAAQLRDRGIASLGVPCIGSLTGALACDRDDWTLLLRSLDALGADAGIDTVVFGGWAKDPISRVPKARSFAASWRDWRAAELQPRAGAPAQESVRLGAIALAGSLLASALAGVAFSWGLLAALLVVSGGLPAVLVNALDFLAPMWTSPLGAQGDHAIKIVLAFALGALVYRVVRFDAAGRVRQAHGEP